MAEENKDSVNTTAMELQETNYPSTFKLEKLFETNWNDDSSTLASDDRDFHFGCMYNFPFYEYDTWKENGKNYNKNGLGRGEPTPRYKLEKLNIFDVKYMAFTLYNNGSFNHKSLIITRQRNTLIHNDIRLRLCNIINDLSMRKDVMDYRYSRKMLAQKISRDALDVPTKDDQAQVKRLMWICCQCWETFSSYSWSNAHQRDEFQTVCPECGAQRTSFNNLKEKYLFENSNNEFDEKEFGLFGQRINDIIDPLMDSDRYWIPTQFIYHKESKQYQVKKRVMNQDLFDYDKLNRELYDVLGNVLSNIIPMFEYVLNMKINGVYERLNVVISIQDYQLKPQEIYHGKRHREGYKEENIVAAAVYYFDGTDDIIGDNIFEISAAFSAVWQYDKSPCPYTFHGAEYELTVRTGYVLVFNNNNINHRLKQLENLSSQDTLHRKIVVFMLVDPDLKEESVISSPYAQVTGKRRNGEYNMNDWRVCESLVDCVMRDVLLTFPEEIKYVIVRYVVDNIVERRNKRNKVRFERFVPSNDQLLDLKKYKTPWIGIAN
eukprot:20702_1